MRQAMMGMAPLLQLSLLVAILSGQGLFIRKGLAAESESTISLECQVAGLEYQTAPACTCAHQLPVCPDGCQVSAVPRFRAAPYRRWGLLQRRSGLWGVKATCCGSDGYVAAATGIMLRFPRHISEPPCPMF